MKFAQQLQQGAVEEWRRAYVDYRLLKKLIKLAAKSQDVSRSRTNVAANDSERDPVRPPVTVASPEDSQILIEAGSSDEDVTLPNISGATATRVSSRSSRPNSIPPRPSISAAAADAFAGLRNRKASGRTLTLKESRWRYPPDLSLEEAMTQMTGAERKFFVVLNSELEKVENFYEEREGEALKRYKVLREQLDQLAEHRQEYLSKHSQQSKIIKPLMSALNNPLERPTPTRMQSTGSIAHSASHSVNHHKPVKTTSSSHMGRWTTYMQDGFHHYQPDNYLAARRKLKLAVYEFYKYLGYLKNYRLLNRTGFSKSCKKMEKMTNIKCQQAFMEKVHHSTFSSSTVVDDLQAQTETMFGASFEKGSRKRAVQRLRFMGASATTHHFAVWRAGIFLGLAIPPMVDALVRVCQDDTRARIPAWPTLLQIWGALFLPNLLGFGIGWNLVGWAAAHINVPLVFYFDARTHIDFRQFQEIPSLLLCVFAYCMWASFAIVSDVVSPQVWPIVFICITIVYFFNPVPIFHYHARWWLVRSTTRVISAGLVRVNFRDFWLGDQFCSLYYLSYNLGLIVCSYRHHFAADTNTYCSTNETWVSPVLASLPYLWRLGQSIRRYTDAPEVPTHLVNAGKYSAGVLYFFLYFNWRINGNSGFNSTFALFVVFAVANSTYSVVWDVIMDWNLFQRDAKHRFLRKELAYRNNIWFYYFAILTNVALRYTWFIYIPPWGSVRLRGFLVAVLETVRRWQWNFIRVESEHIGNVDGFRATRDVPLPYTLHNTSSSGQHELDDDDNAELCMPEKGGALQMSPRTSAFAYLLPGEVGKRLKAAIFGSKAEDEFASEEDDSSPHEGQDASSSGRHSSSRSHSVLSPALDPQSERSRMRTEDRASLLNSKNNSRNYNTFGWDSDVEAVRHPQIAHTATHPGTAVEVDFPRMDECNEHQT